MGEDFLVFICLVIYETGMKFGIDELILHIILLINTYTKKFLTGRVHDVRIFFGNE